ncbi:hypothetical protein IP88_13725 [alpha proteobacterium AAP81b]|nr:hypothetical protein IP88_13725 [alpha proteobacterium AAP81b]
MTLRQATADDAAALAELLNAVIALGGTTALETPFTPSGFAEVFITGAKCRSCLMAIAEDGSAAGFQLLAHEEYLPAGWADIGSFARAQPRIRGVGKALFPETVAVARGLGLTTINATIRADNVPGLAYYSGLGFETWKVVAGVPLLDGTPVDRIWKRYRVA